MGNRAVVVFEQPVYHSRTHQILRYVPAPVGAYLHWNGGPESVYPVLDALDRYKVRTDGEYEVARFLQIMGNHFGGCDSLGAIGVSRHALLDADKLHPGDNGIYVVCRVGGQRRMRRFTSVKVDGQWVPQWLTPEQVELERVAAYEHPYNQPDEDGDCFATGLDTVNRVFFEETPYSIPHNQRPFRRVFWESPAEPGTTGRRFNSVSEFMR